MAMVVIDIIIIITITYRGGSHQLGDDVDGDREDDRAVVLRRDAVQRLQVAQLRR